MVPNISFTGHLAGILVGLLLITKCGTDYLMPSPGIQSHLNLLLFDKKNTINNFWDIIIVLDSLKVVFRFRMHKQFGAE